MNWSRQATRSGDRLLYLREPPFRGDDVLALQVKLNLLGFNAGAERGVYDEHVERAVLDFQQNAGLPLDGLVGESTLLKLEALRKAESGREGKKIPERDGGQVAARSLAGQSVVIDPGHGGPDTGYVSPHGLAEKDVDLALGLRARASCCAPRAVASTSPARRTSRCPCTRAPRRRTPPARPTWCRCTATATRLLRRVAPPATSSSAATTTRSMDAAWPPASEPGWRPQARATSAVSAATTACLRESHAISVLVEPLFLTSPVEEADGPPA